MDINHIYMLFTSAIAIKFACLNLTYKPDIIKNIKF